MKKKGISPVIATVLLIAIVMVLAAIIFLWAKAFISESSVKGDRAVSLSCQEVVFESLVVKNDVNCQDINGLNSAALDINNIGNIPVYGLRILEWDETVGSLVAEEVFPEGTITIGKSETICLGRDVVSEEAFRVVPKLLAEDSSGRKTVYTCPEKDGETIAYLDF